MVTSSSGRCTSHAHLCEVQPVRVHDEALRAAQHAQADRGLRLEGGRHCAAALAQVVRPRQVDGGIVLLCPHQLHWQKHAWTATPGLEISHTRKQVAAISDEATEAYCA